MSVKQMFIKIITDREKIVTLCCFWGLVCFNIMWICLLTYFMFSYEGGTSDPKAYDEIKTIAVAQKKFLQNMLENWLYGILFVFPLVWCYFFTKRINLNAVLIQLLPVLVVVGIVIFNP